MTPDDMIGDFLAKKLKTNFNTCKNYRIVIQNYFKTINQDMNTYFTKDKTPDDYEKDLRKVYYIHEKMGKPKFSRKTYFSVIKVFFASQDDRLNDLRFWTTLKDELRNAEPVSDETILNRDIIKNIISHGNTCSRALFLMLASSGRRIGEILALYEKDVDVTSTPATIYVKKTYDPSSESKVSDSTKTGKKTLCFISDEARDAYIAWMKERDTYLKNSVKRSHFHKKNADDKRVFPMCYSNAIVMWVNLLVKAGYITREEYKVKRKEPARETERTRTKFKITNGTDDGTGRLLIHPHCLRKHFRGYLGDADLAEFLMGHSTQLTKTYNQMTVEDRGKKYLACVHNMTFFSEPTNLDAINEKMKEKDKWIKDLESQITDIQNMLGMKKDLEKIVEKINGKK